MDAKRVLICAAHPDDEALGCGGTIARYAESGVSVHVLFVADGVSARSNDNGTEQLAARRNSANAACEILGAHAPLFLDYPDQRLDQIPLLDVTQSIEAVLNDIIPEIVYTHHRGDLNTDHQIVAQCVLTATRPQPGQPVSAIYGFETLSSTEWAFGEEEHFAPTRFVGIDTVLERKLAALREYEQEMRPFPHARSCENVRALAALRGAMVGISAAEAFSVYRQIEA
ncbi:MAG: PIG-L family deacetylase [Hyphomicrobiales bacterium]|nr:PIG-L family deacetylase [Hyphomicrobiales bacterium]